MINKKWIFPVFAAFLGFVFLLAPYFAQGALSFGIKNPGLLPTSPLYFLKELRRDFVRMFVTDGLSQARLELRIVDEKAAELKKVLELKSVGEVVVRHALKGYSNSIKKFTSELKSVELGSGGNRISVFLEELFGRVAEHEKFLASVSQKYNNEGDISDLAARMQDEIGKAAVIVSEEAPRDVLESAVKKSFGDKGLDAGEETSPRVIEKIAEIVPGFVAGPFFGTSSTTATSSEMIDTVQITNTDNLQVGKDLSQ